MQNPQSIFPCFTSRNHIGVFKATCHSNPRLESLAKHISWLSPTEGQIYFLHFVVTAVWV
jgi:hypothetical protein